MNESRRMGNSIKALVSDAIHNKIGTGCNVVGPNISKLHWTVMCLSQKSEENQANIYKNSF